MDEPLFPDDRPGTAGNNPANEPQDMDALATALRESDLAAEELGLTEDQARQLIERQERNNMENDAPDIGLGDPNEESDLSLDAHPAQRDSRAIEKLKRPIEQPDAED